MPYKDKNDPRLLAYRRKQYIKNKDKFWSYEVRKDSIIKWSKNNPDKVKKINKNCRDRRSEETKNKIKQRAKTYDCNNMKKHSAELSDLYVSRQLVRDGFKKKELTPELIEVKRLIIKTKRL